MLATTNIFESTAFSNENQVAILDEEEEEEEEEEPDEGGVDKAISISSSAHG